MTDTPFSIDRRALLGGLGTTLAIPSVTGWAQTRTALALEAVTGAMALRDGQPPVPVWQLSGGPDAGPLRFRRGETLDVTLTNRLPVPVALNWIGLDGHPMAEPFTGRPAIAPNASATTAITFRQAGTMLANFLAFGDGSRPPSVARPIIISETEPLAFDRDEVVLFQDWRLKPDGSTVPPDAGAADATTVLTANGKISFDIIATQNQRLRLRFINSCQRTVIALKISDINVHVLAIDGQPSEPFLAREGMVVLVPGSRIDVIVDAVRPPGSTSAITLLDGREARPIGKLTVSDARPARPAPMPAPAALPSNGLPAQLDLRSALRIDLSMGTADWLAPIVLGPTTPPAFKVKRGRTVVLALTNRGAMPTAFHLHGHHFRLLDRLDDGWKPFWLDTLAVNAGQTQRIAFAAEFAGLYPISTIETGGVAPFKARSYLVET